MINKKLESLIEEELNKFLNEAPNHADNDFVDRSNIDLQHEYDKLNKELFGGSLPRILLKWDNRKTMGGHVNGTVYNKNRYNEEIVVNHLSISLFHKTTYEQFKNILAHEMIHVKQMAVMKTIGGHKSDFYSEQSRINNMGLGYHVTQKVEDQKPVSDNILARRSGRSFIAIVYNLDGRYQISVTSLNVYNAEFDLIVRTFQSIVNNTGKYRSVEITVIESRNLNLIQFPLIRSFKLRVRHSLLSDDILGELLEEKIIKEVKIKKGVPAEISEDLQSGNPGEGENFEIS